MKYRKKPIEVEAIRFDGRNFTEIALWSGQEWEGFAPPAAMELEAETIPKEAYQLHIPTLEGPMMAIKGDYIIKGIKGEFYPCKPDIFEGSYDVVEEDRIEVPVGDETYYISKGEADKMKAYLEEKEGRRDWVLHPLNARAEKELQDALSKQNIEVENPFAGYRPEGFITGGEIFEDIKESLLANPILDEEWLLKAEAECVRDFLMAPAAICLKGHYEGTLTLNCP